MNASTGEAGKTRTVARRKGKAGRPRTLDNPQMVSMRWGAETLRVARVLAARQQISVSELVRRLVMDEAARESQKTKTAQAQ